MAFIEIAKKRFSVRKFTDQQVEKEKLEAVLEAGRIAPSAVNFQPWRFVVLQDEKIKNAVCSSYKRDWILKAPTVIVVCGNHSEAWRRGDGKDHCDIDVAIAVDHMTLAAADLGLGTCWVCNFDSMYVSRILELPKGMEAAVLLPIGYPVDNADIDRFEKLRKPAGEIIFWDKGPTG